MYYVVVVIVYLCITLILYGVKSCLQTLLDATSLLHPHRAAFPTISVVTCASSSAARTRTQAEWGTERRRRRRRAASPCPSAARPLPAAAAVASTPSSRAWRRPRPRAWWPWRRPSTGAGRPGGPSGRSYAKAVVSVIVYIIAYTVVNKRMIGARKAEAIVLRTV